MIKNFKFKETYFKKV